MKISRGSVDHKVKHPYVKKNALVEPLHLG